MKEITRHEAETLFDMSHVIASDIRQKSGTTKIEMTFSDQRVFVVQYDRHDQQKRYFYQDALV